MILPSLIKAKDGLEGAHPSLSEVVMELGLKANGQAIHV